MIHDVFATAGIVQGAPRGPRDSFAADVIAGLSARHKRLLPKYFYDASGSRLFSEICIPKGAALVEFGSGESAKTRLLLNAAPHLSTYVPIDISAGALDEASARLAREYPQLSIAPVVADFTEHFRLPTAVDGRPRVGFFSGSTIGNFDRD